MVALVESEQGSLHAEIEDLRAKFPETQALYREVCALLFFRHGVTPTANRLYQLVRKGSMSAPAEALARFWEELRKKSRIRIEHADLPPELGALAGELIGSLWQRAHALGEEGFEAAQSEARAATAAAAAESEAAQARADAASHALFQLQSEFSTNLTRLQEAENSLAREQGVRAALERQVQAAAGRHQELLADAQRQRAEFEARLETQRVAARMTEERHQGEVRRNLLELERERAIGVGRQQELEDARQRAVDQNERHASEIGQLQQELALVRQNLGEAAGSLTQIRAARDMLQHRLDKVLAETRRTTKVRKGLLRRS